MDGKSIKVIVTFGVMAALALTLLMCFSLNQMPDAQTPQIAADVAEDFARALAPSPPANVKLTMSREGKGANAPRTYRLTLRPGAAVAADEKALGRLMYRAAERCAGEIGDVPCDVTIRCVAELEDGREREALFAKDRPGQSQSLALIHALPTPHAAPAGTGKR